MSESQRISRPLFVDITFGVVLAVVTSTASVRADVAIPSDAQASNPAVACTVSPTDFNGWFETGTPSLNGVVKPADSLNFPDKPNCTFYQWAEQMFLWLTSPAVCSGNTRTFGSKEFFGVSPPDGDGNRILINHNCNLVAPPHRILSLRSAQRGPHGLPVIFDKAGRMFEVETPLAGPTGKPLVFSSANVSEEVQGITEKDKTPVFLNKAGKPISGARPIMRNLRTPHKRDAIVQKFTRPDAAPIFVDAHGNKVEVEQEQARDSGVLMAQNNSLIYYGTSVNDVYAYFLTGLKTKFINATNPTTQQPLGQFPTTAADLAQITTFASEHGVTLAHPNALAVEIKTSWVEIAPGPNHCNSKAPPPALDPSRYVTMTAIVPAYDTTDCTNAWIPKGTRTAQLAMVGMHVVGSTGSLCDPTTPGGCRALNASGLHGHPEMIWATFEHIGNTPLADYTYNATTGLQTVKQNTAGAWLFSASNSAGPFNCMHMRLDNATGNIVSANTGAGSPCPASTFGSFTPSDTLRMKAWGAASNLAPNPVDRSTADSNTEIISIDHSVREMIPAGDVRSNYYLAGATWTIGGGSPLAAPPSPTSPGAVVGTSMLAGSTMETYQQGPDNTASGGTNCFGCHSDTKGGSASFLGAPSLGTIEVSHIFEGLQPLSFAPLSIRVTSLPTTSTSSSPLPIPRHTILVTVNDSGSGAPVAGAKVNVSDPDGIAVIASGTTSSTGTVTLTYVHCSVVEQGNPAGAPPNPVVVTVPCDGSVGVAGFPPVTFSAP